MTIRHCVVTVCCVLLMSAAGAAQKMTEQLKCSKPDQEHAIPVGDAPGHIYSITHSTCIYPKPGNIGVAKKVSGEDVVFIETRGSRSTWRGVFTETMSNGDKLYYRHTGWAVLKDGAFASGEDRWEVSSGTGSYKGFTGKGICKPRPQPDGTFMDECSGEYKASK
jgi:hypothetical protein